MKQGISKKELADALGKTTKTVQRMIKRGCPHWRVAGRPRFDLEQVETWILRHDDEDDDEGSDQPAVPSFGSKASIRKADLARKVTAAKKSEMELAAERALKDLGLDARIVEAKTYEDLAGVAKQVSAHVSSGRLSPARGTAIQRLLAETRQSLKAAQETATDEDLRPVLLCSHYAYLLAKAFDRLVGDEFREQVLDFIEQVGREDIAKYPNRTRAEVHGEDEGEADAVPCA